MVIICSNRRSRAVLAWALCNFATDPFGALHPAAAQDTHEKRGRGEIPALPAVRAPPNIISSCRGSGGEVAIWEPEDVALLLLPGIEFQASQEVGRYWFDTHHQVQLYFLADPLPCSQLQFQLLDMVGNSLPPESWQHDPSDEDSNGLFQRIDVSPMQQPVVIEFQRSQDLDRAQRFELRLRIDGVQDLWPTPDGTSVGSPVRGWPGLDPICSTHDGRGGKAFFDYVDAVYNYRLEWPWQVSFPFYATLNQLIYAFFPPAGDNGPEPPDGATHDENYCAVSVFIHSMTNTFPGSLPKDVSSNRLEWDRVATRIGHDDYFGCRGGKFVDYVNENYGRLGRAADGNKYCAKKVKDISINNLKKLNQKCDLKLLCYDIFDSRPGRPWVGFGHWVDVTGVDTKLGQLTLQDYDRSYNVGYKVEDPFIGYDYPIIDFTGAHSKSVMGGWFDGSNPKCGDESGEWCEFYAVCKC